MRMITRVIVMNVSTDTPLYLHTLDTERRAALWTRDVSVALTFNNREQAHYLLDNYARLVSNVFNGLTLALVDVVRVYNN